jgi:hypothetical protein
LAFDSGKSQPYAAWVERWQALPDLLGCRCGRDLKDDLVPGTQQAVHGLKSVPLILEVAELDAR